MKLRCSQCGAHFDAPAGLRLTQCPYCDTALAIDARGTLLREVMLPTISAENAPRHLKRFLAGRKTVANLDRDAIIASAELLYFPFWAFSFKEGGKEVIRLVPAAPASFQGLHGLDLPAGKTSAWKEGLTGDVPVLEAEIPVDTAQQWLNIDTGTQDRVVLYHLPVYLMNYRYKGKDYRAGVDAVSGKIFPGDYPAKAEAPYIGVAILALIVFGLEGLIISNLFIKALVYLLSAVPIIAIAWLISRKV